MTVSGSTNGRGKKVNILIQRNKAHSNEEGVGDATKDVRGISDCSETTLLGSRSDGTEELGEYARRREGEATHISSGSGKGKQGIKGTLPTLQKLMTVDIMLVPSLVTQACSVFFVFNNRSNFR
jgi:hypothetical protein